MSDKKKLFVAGFWVILIFGVGQLVRLGSNLIVTRMLEPEMFGVMAIVYVVTTGIAMFSDLGLWAFIVRHKDASNLHMLSARSALLLSIVKTYQTMLVSLVGYYLSLKALKNISLNKAG